jgi:hypothetical protein
MRHGRSAHATLVGGAQADAAAAGASGMVRAMMKGDIAAPGAWMPEQVDDHPRRASGVRAPFDQEDRNHQ